MIPPVLNALVNRAMYRDTRVFFLVARIIIRAELCPVMFSLGQSMTSSVVEADCRGPPEIALWSEPPLAIELSPLAVSAPDKCSLVSEQNCEINQDPTLPEGLSYTTSRKH